MNQSESNHPKPTPAERIAAFGHAGDPAARPRRGSGTPATGVSVGNQFFKAAGAITPATIRAWALVTAVLVFVMTVVLTPLSVTPWWSPLLALVALAGVVAWLRSRVIRGQAQASTPRRQPRPVTNVERQRAERPAVETPAVPVYDVDAPAASTAPAAADLPAEDAPAEAPAPGTWAPVAVPPPTYTLKAKADRPEPEPAATAEITPETSAAEKYANTPVEDLPFDGLALDEDLEDLPAVHHRAG